VKIESHELFSRRQHDESNSCESFYFLNDPGIGRRILAPVVATHAREKGMIRDEQSLVKLCRLFGGI